MEGGSGISRGIGLQRTWPLRALKCTAAINVAFQAIKAGYRLFDGAYDYGNEKEAGQGIRRAIDEGLVERKDIFVTTKLWNTCHQK